MTITLHYTLLVLILRGIGVMSPRGSERTVRLDTRHHHGFECLTGDDAGSRCTDGMCVGQMHRVRVCLHPMDVCFDLALHPVTNRVHRGDLQPAGCPDRNCDFSVINICARFCLKSSNEGQVANVPLFISSLHVDTQLLMPLKSKFRVEFLAGC